MLFRLVIAFIIAVAVFAVLRITFRGKSLSVSQFMQIYFVVLIGLTLMYLGLTGKLHPLFVILGVALPFLMRLLTWIPRVLQLFSIFRFLRGFIRTGSPQSSPSGQGRISDINTRFLHMVLFHDSGMMDGEVLAGKFSGSKLSMMELEELLNYWKNAGSMQIASMSWKPFWSGNTRTGVTMSIPPGNLHRLLMIP